MARGATDLPVTDAPLRRAALTASLALALAFGGGCGGDGVAAGSSSPALAAAPESDLDLGPLPDFALVSQLGEPVTRASLAGRPFVMGAIFTTCTGPCPSVSRSMQEVRDALADTGVRLVSISVDPRIDRPDVLKAYAESLGADPGRWLFLTGDEGEVYELVQQGFLMSAVRVPEHEAVSGQQVTHDIRLVAVDRHGHRRGWYVATRDDHVAALIERMRFLDREE